MYEQFNGNPDFCTTKLIHRTCEGSKSCIFLRNKKHPNMVIDKKQKQNAVKLLG